MLGSRLVRSAQHRDHRDAADHRSPAVTRSVRVMRQEHVHPRSELHHAEAIAGRHHVAFPDPAHDAPRQDADDLPDDDRLATVVEPRPRCAR